jgi:mRNA-degrading endonuclease RelE of RelBE toxin-antitoxin system
MEFIEAPAFTRHIAEYLDDESYSALQNELADNPEAGDVMPGTGGFRKVRWADPRRGKGRRGGLRVIYYYFLSDFQILLVTVYGKDEAADLSPSEKRALKNAIAAELSSREARRSARQSRTRRKS